MTRFKAHFQDEAEKALPTERFFSQSAVKGLALFDLLARRYDVVAANPPYMGSKKMGSWLKSYIDTHYPEGKRDIYAAFILRNLQLSEKKGRVAMVTQQSWMFIRSFMDLRAMEDERLKNEPKAKFIGLLRQTSLETLAHLGPNAFPEISGEVVNTVMFTLVNTVPNDKHQLTAFRLIGTKSPEEKEIFLCNLKDTLEKKYVSYPQQFDFFKIPTFPMCYWINQKFTKILSLPLLGEKFEVPSGFNYWTNPRFVRFQWEVGNNQHKKTINRWFRFDKGGGYCKWIGYHFWSVDWEDSGVRIKSRINPLYNRPYSNVWMLKKTELNYFFKEGWTYSRIARGSLSFRKLIGNEIISEHGLFTTSSAPYQIGFLNSRIYSFIIRLFVQGIDIRESYIKRLPISDNFSINSNLIINHCFQLKSVLISNNPLEFSFKMENMVFIKDINKLMEIFTIESVLLSIESFIEYCVFKGFDIKDENLDIVFEETGTPAGWFPLITNYDTFPSLLKDFPKSHPEFIEYFITHKRIALPDTLKLRLRSLYEAGPGIKDEQPDELAESNEEDALVGSCIPVPAETFLEELSQKIEIHPVSIYWLLKEGIENEGWRCIPEEKRCTEDSLFRNGATTARPSLAKTD